MGNNIIVTSTTETVEEMATALSDTGGRGVIPEHPGREDGGEIEVEAQAEGEGESGEATKEAKEATPEEKAEAATAAAAAAAKPGDKKEEVKTEKKEEPAVEGTSQTRINRLTWEREEAKRTAAAAVEENARLKAALEKAGVKLNDPVTAGAVAPVYSVPAPVIDDFETVEEFTIEVGKWASDKAQFEFEAKQNTRTAATTATELDAAHINRIAEFEKVAPDFKAVGQKAIDEGLPVTVTMLGFFKRSTLGPAIMYRLAKNPDLCFEVANLSPAEQLIRLGEIQYEERVNPSVSRKPENDGTKDGGSAATKESPSTPKVNQRPAPARVRYRPINPVSSTPSKTNKHPDDMTPAEFKAWRAAGGGKAPVAQDKA